MVLYLIIALLGLSALAVVVLGIFMLLDVGKRGDDERDDIASKITKAVDATANANGLWTRKMRIRAVCFLVALVVAAGAAVYVLENFPRGGNWGIGP